MKSKHENFHDPRFSMLLSGLSHHVKETKEGKKGMNADHDLLSSTSKILNKKLAKPPSLLRRLIARFLAKILKFFVKERKGLFDDCLEILIEYMMLKVAKNEAAAEKKKDELKFSQCDPAWVNSVLVWIDTYILDHEKPAYVKYENLDDFTYSIPEKDLKIGVIGDWGTGEDEAETVLDNVFAQKPDLIIHVGDIYYSGTEKEYQDNYLDVINQYRAKHESNVPVYNLPGNHDYYSGGQPFYDFLAKTNPDTGYPEQQASYFNLNNSVWQLQGMDTGYNDRHVFEVGQDKTHLEDSEVKWHQHQLDKGIKDEKKIMLFSHHQLFSKFINVGNKAHNPELLSVFENYFENITGWLWGHEHLLEIYEPFLGLQKGRCIGIGAVPIIYDGGSPYKAIATYKDKPITPLPKILPESIADNNGEVYANGFAMLDLNLDKTGKASYYTVFPGQKAKKVYSEGL